MGIADRIGLAARTTAARLSGAFASLAATPIVPGVGRTFGQYNLPQDSKAQKVVDSREALYGRVTTSLGPIQSHISTHPLRGLTPARVSSIMETVLVAGWMVDWACLVEDVVKGDTQVKAVDKSGREAVTGAPFTVEPADASPEARAIADYQAAVIDGISGWDRSVERLLLGNAGGYALEDVVYEDKTVSFPYEDSHLEVTAPTPTGLEFVHQKHTRWNLGSGDLLELDCGGSYVVPPEHKFVYYQASDDFQVRRRGYMYQAVWLCLIKQNAWARWGVLLDIWGIRAPWGKVARDLWQDATRRADFENALRKIGLGLPALFTDDFEVEPSPGISDGDSRGMHAALISAINLELSKLILGSTLTTEISGTGSYNASETHADTKQARVIGWERNLSSCVRDWMRAALKLACYLVNPDGSLGEVNPRGLSAQLGITPERCIALCGRPTWRVQREVTPQVRMDLYDKGVNRLGLEIDSDAPYREFGFPRARHASKRLRGAPVTLAGDAAAVPTSDALEGADNPKLEAPEAPVARRRQPRRKRN